MRRLLLTLPNIYLLRFPLLFAIILLFFPFVALKTPSSSLFAGIFDLAGTSSVKTGGRMFFVALLALNVAWTILETFWLVLLYAPERFGVSQLPPKWTKKQHALVFALLAAPILVGAVWESATAGQAKTYPLLVGAVLGVIVAILLLWGINAVTDRRVNSREEMLDNVKPGWFARQQTLSVGYFSQEANRSRLRPGHLRATTLLGVSFLIYVGIGISKDLKMGFSPIVPTLAYVLLLLMLLCWALAGMAFFLDRYRVPIFLPFALLFAMASLFPQSDYYYFLMNGQEQRTLLPRTVMKAGDPTRSSAVVIAASGGGIQAAAWTARVLTGLEQKSREEIPAHDFGKSIRFISAVSGGSVGTMYFVSEYTPNGLPGNDELQSVLARAEESSLDDVAWGLLYPDIWRTIIPLFPFKHADRGDALERAFTRGPGLTRALGEWRTGVREGWRPATAFNATIVDSGARLLFSTSDLGPRPGRVEFYEPDRYPDRDIGIVTAVRLSSTFPYVSPAARADAQDKATAPQFHIVDGGYYDNYGISTLVEWLDSALDAPDNAVQRVLVIQIRDSSPDKPAKGRDSNGSFYQSFAPISTMLRVRSTGQLSHNEEETSLVQRVRFKPDVSIENAIFQFCGEKPPLSWHLTQTQKQSIEAEWDRELTASGSWQIVKNFLSGGPPPLSPGTPPCVDSSADAPGKK